MVNILKNKIFVTSFFVVLFMVAYVWDHQENNKPRGDVIANDAINTLENSSLDWAKVQMLNIESPEIKQQTIDDFGFDLSNLESEYVLINFWASWCAPCLQEMPSMLERVNTENGRISLVAISTDRKRENINKFFKKLQPLTHQKIKQENVYWLWDETQEISLKKFNTLKVPETFVLHKKNNMYTIVAKVVGLVDWKVLNINKLTTD